MTSSRYLEQAVAAAVWVESEAHRMMDDMAEHGFKATRVQDSILFDFDPAGARAQMGLTPPRSQHMGHREPEPPRITASEVRKSQKALMFAHAYGGSVTGNIPKAKERECFALWRDLRDRYRVGFLPGGVPEFRDR